MLVAVVFASVDVLHATIPSRYEVCLASVGFGSVNAVVATVSGVVTGVITNHIGVFMMATIDFGLGVPTTTRNEKCSKVFNSGAIIASFVVGASVGALVTLAAAESPNFPHFALLGLGYAIVLSLHDYAYAKELAILQRAAEKTNMAATEASRAQQPHLPQLSREQAPSSLAYPAPCMKMCMTGKVEFGVCEMLDSSSHSVDDLLTPVALSRRVSKTPKTMDCV